MANKELLETVAANPDLPIVAFVNGDICHEENMYWMASFGSVEVREVGIVGERYYDDRDSFKEAYYDKYAEQLTEKFNYHPRIGSFGDYTQEVIEANDKAEAELEKYLDEMATKYMKKCIVVYVDEPDLTDWEEA